MKEKNKKIEQLKEYCEKNPAISLAFLYGSVARGKETDDSDFDVAVLLAGRDEEDRVWRDVSGITEKNVDLVSIERAPASLVSSIFKTGIPLVIKDRKKYLDLYLEKTQEAEDFAEFAKNYFDIYQRSQSLTPEDRTRLIDRVQFLEQELSDRQKFSSLTYQEYQEDRAQRRELERWAENIINALIDCAKIILASEKKSMPKTYEAALSEFGILAGLSEEQALRFATLARLRNILAHEYLDILYEKIQECIEKFESVQKDIFLCLKRYTDGVD
ncbi:MAG: DUF86 domain-containing protein [bacterium]|nr:DUF86 domain-containing protein [bacterium]